MRKQAGCAFFLCLFLNLWSLHASSSLPGCDPEIRQALDEAAVQGIQRSTHTVHEAYSRPESTFDLSCLEDYMSGLNGFSFLIDPGKLLGNFLEKIKNQICDHADRLWVEKRRKFEELTPDLIFRDIPGTELRSSSYKIGKSPVKAKVQPLSPDVELVLPKVMGKELPSSSLKGLLQ